MSTRQYLILALSSISLHCLCAAPLRAADPEQIVKKWSSSVVLVTLLDGKGNELARGSGFVVGPELVATCYHVVAGGVSAQVKTADAIIYPVTGVVASDRKHDLAILKVKKLGENPSVTLADSSHVRPGEAVVAIGSSLGLLEGSVSTGVTSGLRDLPDEGEVLQVSAPVSPGNSGGPLFDPDGDVIGVVKFTLTRGQNLNFATPSNALKELLRQTRDSPADINSLTAEKGELLTEIGVLPARSIAVEIRIPKKPPYTVAVPSQPEFDIKTISVSVEKRTMQRVESEEDLGPTKYVLTPIGVLKFDAAEKGKKLRLEGQYKPYRVAVFIAGDASSGELRPIVQKALEQLGSEVVVGAEVDAAIDKSRQQGLSMQDLARLLNCGRLVTARLEGRVADENQYQWAVSTTVSVRVDDLNSGRELLNHSAGYSGVVGKLRSWRKMMRDLGESCLADILVPSK